MLNRLIILLILSGAAFVVGLVTYDQPDWHLSFLLLDYQISINMALLLAGICVAVIVLDTLASLLHLPVKLIQHLNQRRDNRQFHCFMTGLSWYAQGGWRQACKQLTRAGRDPKYQFHANLFAAYAYLEQQQPDHAWTALQTARQAEHKDHFALALAEARVLLAQGQNDQARTILTQLRTEQPHNAQVNALLNTDETST